MGADEAGEEIAALGVLLQRVRFVRTSEGWEAATLLLGDVTEGDAGLLVVCSGRGASGLGSAVAPGDEVLALGRLRARRSGTPELDSVELEASALLIRPSAGGRTRLPGRPRIAA